MAGENETEDFSNISGNTGADQLDDNLKVDNVDAGNDLDKILDEFVEKSGAGKTTQDTTKQQDTGTDTTKKPAQGKDGKAADTTGQDAGGTTTDRPVPQTAKQFGTLFRSDTTGAVYDAAGRKIANPGLERRIFERVHNIYSGMETEHAALRQKLEGIENANQAARDAGLSIEEHGMGLRLMAAWKKDKLQTLNFLLSQATNAGIDVSSIRAGGVDMAAFERTIEARLTEALKPFMPIVQNLQHDAEMTEMRDAAAQELTEFYTEFPIARQHADIIAAIMDKTGYSMRESLFALQAQAAQNGWDMSKPLQPQAQATAQRSGNGTRSDPTGGRQRLPAMNGRDAGNGSTVQAGSRAPASHEASWEDIIGDVAKEHGVNLG